MRSLSKPIFSWCLYDWANSVLATLIFTFIFSVYFSRGVVGDETLGSAYWGYTIGISGGIIAIISPVLGAMSDIVGRRKPILLFLTLITLLATIAMFWVMPDPSYIMMALILVGVATVGFELAQAQYNAMITDIAPPDRLGRISGLAWSMGYFGGLICLIIALLGFIGLGDDGGFLGLSKENSLDIRATCLLAAAWYAVFAIPLFLYVKDRPKNNYNGAIVKRGVQNLWRTLTSLRHGNKNIAYFLISSAIYRDGLNTLFAVGGLYAAGTFGMNFQDILIFAIGLNITAGIGAFALSYMDDKIGAKPTIILSLIGLIICGSGIVLTNDKTIFMTISLALGLFVGSAQSSSRSLMARLCPKESSTEIFGLYSMTGKSVAFTGPLVFALITQMTDSQRWGVATIIGFWLIGLIILMKVKEK